VSLGLVQHHFATKAGLIKSVDDYVLELVTTAMARPIPEPPVDSVAEIGSGVNRIIAEQPDLAGYLGRALVDGNSLGAVSLRTHIDRHLPEPFTTPGQLQRWETAVNSLLRDGTVPAACRQLSDLQTRSPATLLR
jgi:hypothetical protein